MLYLWLMQLVALRRVARLARQNDIVDCVVATKRNRSDVVDRECAPAQAVGTATALEHLYSSQLFRCVRNDRNGSLASATPMFAYETVQWVSALPSVLSFIGALVVLNVPLVGLIQARISMSPVVETFVATFVLAIRSAPTFISGSSRLTVFGSPLGVIVGMLAIPLLVIFALTLWTPALAVCVAIPACLHERHDLAMLSCGGCAHR